MDPLQAENGGPMFICVVRVHINYMQDSMSATFFLDCKVRTMLVAIGTQARVSTQTEITYLSGDPFKSAYTRRLENT